MTHLGGCLCGEIQFKVQGTPDRATVCHCRVCQLRTGSAFGIGVYFLEEKINLVSGNLESYKFVSASGNNVKIDRCVTCGTPIFWQTDRNPGVIGTSGGSFDPPTFWYRLTSEAFTRSKAEFCIINSPESNETSATYNPVNKEEARFIVE